MSRLKRNLFLALCFCLFANPLAAASEQEAGKSVTIASFISDKLHLRHIGVTVFGNEQKTVDVSDWNVEKEFIDEFQSKLKSNNLIFSVLENADDDILSLSEKVAKESSSGYKIKDNHFLSVVSDIKTDYLIILSNYEASALIASNRDRMIKNYGFINDASGGGKDFTTSRNILKTKGAFFVLAYVFDIKNEIYIDRYNSFGHSVLPDRALTQVELDEVYNFLSEGESNEVLLEQYRSIIYETKLKSKSDKEKLYTLYEKENDTLDDFDDNIAILEHSSNPFYVELNTFDKLSESEKAKLDVHLESLQKQTAIQLADQIKL